jgi:hypothetical protein
MLVGLWKFKFFDYIFVSVFLQFRRYGISITDPGVPFQHFAIEEIFIRCAILCAMVSLICSVLRLPSYSFFNLDLKTLMNAFSGQISSNSVMDIKINQ